MTGPSERKKPLWGRGGGSGNFEKISGGRVARCVITRAYNCLRLCPLVAFKGLYTHPVHDAGEATVALISSRSQRCASGLTPAS